MHKSKGTLFYNPASGSSGNGTAELCDAARKLGLGLAEVGSEVPVGEIVKAKLAEGERTFVAAGGDGTIHHLLQHLVGTDAALGVVPLGTFNHLAHDLRLPTDWQTCLEIAVSGKVIRIDTARAGTRYFVNNMMFGIYPEILEYRERHRKALGKWHAFARATRLAMRQFPHVTVHLESAHHMEVVKTPLLVIAVNSYELSEVGLLAPKSTLDDGRMSLYWLPEATRAEFVQAAARYFRGKMEGIEGFRRMSTSRVRLSTSHRKLRFGIDGELLELETPLDVTVVPGSLSVRVGEDFQVASRAI